MKARFFIDMALTNSGVISTATDSRGFPVALQFIREDDQMKARLDCIAGAVMEEEDLVPIFRQRVSHFTWGAEKKSIEAIVMEKPIPSDRQADHNSITWNELLVLLTQFTESPFMRQIRLKKNEAAHSVGIAPEHHVSIDLFVFYHREAPSSEQQKAIARGFVGDNGPRKIWDGLNVAAAWKDPTVRLYNCLLYFPPSVAATIRMADDLKKIGFMHAGNSSMMGSAEYVFEKKEGAITS